ncbi:MAG: hypothetical protein OCD01_16850 [Fibrobacterales bacterium]
MTKKEIAKALCCSEDYAKKVVIKIRKNTGMELKYNLQIKAYLLSGRDREMLQNSALIFTHEQLASIFSLRELMMGVRGGILSDVFDVFWNKIERLCDEKNISLKNWEGKVVIVPIGNRDINDVVVF